MIQVLKNIYRNIEERDTFYYIMFLFVLISGLSCIFTYTVGINPYDAWDFNEGVFWAEATIKAKSIINNDYSYYYFLPFGSNIIMVPYVLLFGTSLLANHLGMLTFFLIYLFTLQKLSKALYNKRKEQLLFSTFTTLFVYTYIGDNLLHHILNYGIGFVCFLGELACAIEIIRNNRLNKSNYILLILFSFWASLNGFASIGFSGACILLSMVITHFKFEKPFSKNEKQVMDIIAISNVVGYFIYEFFNSLCATAHQQNSRFVFASLSDIINHFEESIIYDLCSIFFFVPNKESFFSVDGIFNFVKLAFLSLLVFISIRYLLFTNSNNLEESFINLANSLIILLCTAQYILSEASVQRFLFNALLSMFVVCGLWINKKEDGLKKMTYVLLLFCLILVLSFKQVFFKFRFGEVQKQKMIVIQELLEENDLKYGYTYSPSIYWKQMDLLTAGKSKSLPIGFAPEYNSLYLNSESRRFYKSDLEKPDTDKFYVLIHQMFLNDEDVFVNIKDHLSKSLKQLRFDEGTIFVFDISAWDGMFVVRGAK